MLKILPLLIPILHGSSQDELGQRYIALPGTPVMRDELGRPVNRLKVMFRELTLVRRDNDGTRHFLLDGKLRLKTKVSNPFQSDGLRPLVESEELSALRARYLGRRVWVYGEFFPWRDALQPRSFGFSFVDAGQSLAIVRIYQVDKVSITLRDDSTTQGVRDYFFSGRYEATDFMEDSPFLFVYSLSDSKLSGFGGLRDFNRLERVRAADIRNYSVPYNLFVGSWYLDRLFSLSPPPLLARKALRKARLAEERYRQFHDYLVGMNRVQVAWVFGIPRYREPLARTMNRSQWAYSDHVLITYKTGRVVSVDKASIH